MEVLEYFAFDFKNPRSVNYQLHDLNLFETEFPHLCAYLTQLLVNLIRLYKIPCI